MKKAFMIILVAIGVALCWIIGISSLKPEDNSNLVQFYKDFADEQIQFQAYGSAIDCYKKLVVLEDTADNHYSLSLLYNYSENEKLYEDTLQMIIQRFPDYSQSYEELATYYFQKMKINDCLRIVKLGYSNNIKSKILDELYGNTSYQFRYIGGTYNEAYNFENDLAIVKANDYMGFIKNDMTPFMSMKFDYVSRFTGKIAGVTLEGETFFIDNTGLKYLATGKPYNRVWSMKEGIALAYADDGYNYVNSQFKPIFQVYEDGTSFDNGIAAVKLKEKWMLINTSGEQIGEDTYDDVVINENKECSIHGVVFVKKDNFYYLLNSKGKKVTETKFEDAEPFFTDKITAVKIDGKWGFIDINGNTFIEPQYEGAKAFGNGLAAVSVDGKWGFINTANKLVIPNIFEDAKCFSSNGIAPIKEYGIWKYIKLTT